MKRRFGQCEDVSWGNGAECAIFWIEISTEALEELGAWAGELTQAGS